ncbi:hypothetical protein FPANT_8762 [Fusarium pseudoanthophilum]|uniref:Uncharacterized protein n=1 Tax=Fusarium pseudoanthophilum TaxID=48495 RepID=A0A8H5NYQ9_9HYPO|nr:hypothetical protein FPANT_8762 [Fusarium pseudoanthophilum]
MALQIISFVLSVLVFLLKGLVYLENFWYKVVWSKWRPPSKTVLEKLILRKENEIWHAVIFGSDGDTQRLFKDLTYNPTPEAPRTSSNGATASSPSKVEAGGIFRRPKTNLREAVETDVEEHEVAGRGKAREKAVQGRLEAIADQLANSTRTLNRKERVQTQQFSRGTFSLLWMAIHRDHKKDVERIAPSHRCELGNKNAIENLICNGADLASLNRDGKTPRRVLFDCHDSAEDIWKNMAPPPRRKQKPGPGLSAPSETPSQKHNRIPKAAMAVCKKSAVYCRYQRNDLDTESRDSLNWTAADKYVSDVFDPNHRSKDTTFLDECDKECQRAWKDSREAFRGEGHEDEHEHKPPAGKVAGDTWRWVNFPANNITWIRDFIQDNSNTSHATWGFFESNMEVRDMNNNGFPIRVPHAFMSDGKPSKNAYSGQTETGSVVSLVIPFIDIEVESPYHSTAKQIEEAYSPFTKFDGVQMPQTLDETSINVKSRSKLRNKENQVIYRWSKNKDAEEEKQLPLDLTVRNPGSKLAYLLRTVREGIEMRNKKESRALPSGQMRQGSRGQKADVSAEMHRTRKDRRPKWLMVRQLWLWKLDDGTILSAIPLRTNINMADDLFQIIQQGRLHEISGADDLIKHILQETVTFPDKYLRAGLGEHILDVFESEIASEADKEATFFNNFTQNNWDSEHANSAIDCTWRVKDIRDELNLIKNVFSSQLEVVQQFSTVLVKQKAEDVDYIRNLESKLKGMIDRTTHMEEDAEKTSNSLNGISQAMLSQASLKEAEEARLMNLILLPFTIVTVIFTPLSFMTSLFAVNSDGFPHNEDGELRIPSDWFWRRMVTLAIALKCLGLSHSLPLKFCCDACPYDPGASDPQRWALRRSRSTTTEIATTTISGVASEETTTTAESDSAVETSVIVSTSALETSTLESSTLESTSFQVSTSLAEASTHTTEDATTTTTSPAQSVQTPLNGDFEDTTLAPWESTGTTAVLFQGAVCYQGNQCADLPGPYSGNTAKICQRVDIQQGYEYTFAAHLRQGCTYYSAGEGEDLDCDNNINSVKLSIDGVFDSEAKPVSWDNQYHEYSNTFQYTGPSIDSTDLCVSVIINQGESPCRPTTVTSVAEASSTIASDTTVTTLATTATTALVETTSTAAAESTTTTEAPACVETQVVINPGFDDSASSKSPWSGDGSIITDGANSAPNAISFVFSNGVGDAQISQTLANLDGTYRLNYNWGVFSGVNVGSGFGCSIIPKVGDDGLPGVYPGDYTGWIPESQTWSSGSSAVAQADLSFVLQCGGEYDQLTINIDDITFTKLCGPQAS